MGLRVTFPELTGERRTQLNRLVGEKTEHARVSLRSHRTDAIKEIEALEKGGGMGKDDAFRLKKDMQKIVDDANKKLDEAYGKKEKEILG